MSSAKLGYGNEPLSWRSLPPRERSARAAERRAREAALGFGEEELAVVTSALHVSTTNQDTGFPKKRRLCSMTSGCHCGYCTLQSEAGEDVKVSSLTLATEEERLLQLAISRSLEPSSPTTTVIGAFASIPAGILQDCIVLSDDETTLEQTLLSKWVYPH